MFRALKTSQVFLLDSIAGIISITLIQIAFILLNFKREVDLQDVSVKSVVGFLIFISIHAVVTKLGQNVSLRITMASLVLWALLWNLYFTLLLFLSDRYLLSNPESLTYQHLLSEITAILVLIPLFTIIGLLVIVGIRFLFLDRQEHFD